MPTQHSSRAIPTGLSFLFSTPLSYGVCGQDRRNSWNVFCFCFFASSAILFCFRSIARPYYLLFLYFATLSFLGSWSRLLMLREIGSRTGGGLLCIIGFLRMGWEIPISSGLLSLSPLKPFASFISHLHLHRLVLVLPVVNIELGFPTVSSTG